MPHVPAIRAVGQLAAFQARNRSVRRSFAALPAGGRACKKRPGRDDGPGASCTVAWGGRWDLNPRHPGPQPGARVGETTLPRRSRTSEAVTRSRSPHLTVLPGTSPLPIRSQIGHRIAMRADLRRCGCARFACRSNLHWHLGEVQSGHDLSRKLFRPELSLVRLSGPCGLDLMRGRQVAHPAMGTGRHQR
jgi:hypothetical protein